MRFLAATFLGLMTSLATSCIYHGDDTCSAGQERVDQGECRCKANHVPVKRNITVFAPTSSDIPLVDHCEACGEHSSAVDGKCVCDAGFVQGTSGCVPSNLGATCGKDDDCLNGDNHHCQLASGATTGYCTTTGCTSNADCNVASDYKCVGTGATAFCMPPPLNQGKDCATQGLDQMCGAEAPVCFSGKCTAIGCTQNSDCSPSRKCCDLSALAGQPFFACLGACP